MQQFDKNAVNCSTQFLQVANSIAFKIVFAENMQKK